MKYSHNNWYKKQGQTISTQTKTTKKQIQSTITVRSEAIKLYALKRANGICEGCESKAPFHSKKGPYLEVHHVHRLGDGGPDHPENVIGLCPNCHSRVHHNIDGMKFNKKLIEKLLTIEGE